MKSRGFTLLEVLIAMVILAGAILLVSTAWSGNFMRIRKTRLLDNVSTLLNREMAETEAKYKDKQLTEIPETDGGDFGSDYPNYSWKLESKLLKFPDLTGILVGQQQGADQTLISMIKQMTDYMNQVVKEVKVTITVKLHGKSLNYSAVQYFIDYTKPFTGGGGGLPAGGVTPTKTPAQGGAH